MALKDPRKGMAQKMDSGSKAEQRGMMNKVGAKDAMNPLKVARRASDAIKTGKSTNKTWGLWDARSEGTGKNYTPGEISKNMEKNKPMSDARRAALLKSLKK